MLPPLPDLRLIDHDGFPLDAGKLANPSERRLETP